MAVTIRINPFTTVRAVRGPIITVREPIIEGEVFFSKSYLVVFWQTLRNPGRVMRCHVGDFGENLIHDDSCNKLVKSGRNEGSIVMPRCSM